MKQSNSDGDPCICGERATWHPACYARIQRGFKARNAHGTAKVLHHLAPENYVVLRRPGAMPFLVTMRDYFKDWTPA